MAALNFPTLWSWVIKFSARQRFWPLPSPKYSFKISQCVFASKSLKVYLLQNQPKYICFKINQSTYVCCKIHQSTYILVKLYFCSNPSETLLHLLRCSYTPVGTISLWKMPSLSNFGPQKTAFFEVPLFRIWEIGVKIIDRLANLMTNWCQNAWSFGKFGWCPNTWTMNFEIGVKVLDILANWWQICVKILNLLTNLLTNRCQNIHDLLSKASENWKIHMISRMRWNIG